MSASDSARTDSGTPRALRIYVDADACPVKEEVYRVAGRHGATVTLVSNTWMRTPAESWIRLEVVSAGFDSADDWIVEQVQPADVVITTDVPLASRCVLAGALVLSPTGRIFDEDNVAEALATRDLLADLRSGGIQTTGPSPMSNRDRSLFLQELENLLRRSAKTARP